MQYSELSGEQVRTIIDTISKYGTVALAARNAGIAPGRLRWLIDNDPDLNGEVADALDIFKDAIRLQVLERATVGRSDAMLKLAAESFAPEVFKPAPVDPKLKSRPSGLVLRVFDDQGNEAEGTVGQKTSDPPPPEPPKPQAPREPLRLEVYVGL